MENDKRNGNLKALLIFTGNWEIEGVNFSAAPNSANSPVRGEQNVKVMEGEKFLESRWSYEYETGQHIGISIIGKDNDNENPRVFNFDNTGFHRVYDLEIEGRVWKLTGKAERATIEFGREGKTYKEFWEIKKDEGWHPLCERKATKN